MFVAMTYVSKGDKDAARQYLPQLKELNPQNAQLLEKALAK
jgi:hypothetical protein